MGGEEEEEEVRAWYEDEDEEDDEGRPDIWAMLQDEEEEENMVVPDHGDFGLDFMPGYDEELLRDHGFGSDNESAQDPQPSQSNKRKRGRPKANSDATYLLVLQVIAFLKSIDLTHCVSQCTLLGRSLLLARPKYVSDASGILQTQAVCGAVVQIMEASSIPSITKSYQHRFLQQ